MEISEFYAARLDEDEVAARAAEESGGGDWWTPHEVLKLSSDADGYSDAVHIARHGPARVLRKVEAGRRILARYDDCLARQEDDDYPAGVARDQAREYEDFVLPNLAAEFSDHPDYQESWKP